MLEAFGLHDEQLARLIYLICLLLLVAGGLKFVPGRLLHAARQAGIWLVIIVSLVVVYTYREPLLRAGQPVFSELRPGRASVVIDRNNRESLVYSRSADGQFHVFATVDGVDIDFLIDTGATHTVLTLRDASRTGIATDRLRFNRPVQTANGITQQARARIDWLSMGPVTIRDLGVGVLPDDKLEGSLLGLDVLNRFSELRIEGDRLTLVP